MEISEQNLAILLKSHLDRIADREFNVTTTALDGLVITVPSVELGEVFSRRISLPIDVEDVEVDLYQLQEEAWELEKQYEEFGEVEGE